MDTLVIWNSFLEKIKEQVSSLSYETWFKDTKLVSLDNNTATVIVPMNLHKKHLKENYILRGIFLVFLLLKIGITTQNCMYLEIKWRIMIILKYILVDG